MAHRSRKRNRRVHPSNTKSRQTQVAGTSSVRFTKNATVSRGDFAATNKTVRPKSRMMTFKEASRNTVISFNDSFDESDSEDERTDQSVDRTSATKIYKETLEISQSRKSDHYKTLYQILQYRIENEGFGSITHPSVVCKLDLAFKLRLMKRHQATALREVEFRKACKIQQQECHPQCVNKNSQNDQNYMRAPNSRVTSRGKQCLARQRTEILNYCTPVKPDKMETFEAYLQNLRNYKITETKKEDGCHDLTALEEQLPRLLRYTFKGKYSKLVFYLQDEEKHFKINRVDSTGRTALHYAASRGCLKSLNVLLKVPGIDLNKRDENGKTPLYKAVELNSFECVEALLGAGANAKIPALDSRDPLTWIMHFHGDERFQMFQFLYENGGYNKDQIEPYFVSLLHKAIAADKKIVILKIVNYLIEHGHDINSKEGKSRTPLHLAVMCGRTDILYLLLAHKANIYHMDDHYQSCAAYSIINSLSHRILSDFFEHGSPPVKQAVQCRKNDDDLDIMSKVLEQSMHRRQQIHHM